VRRLTAILAQRCPVCFEGRVFTGPFRMKEHCEVCGVRFEREQGYFLGAMYFSYPAACALIAVTAVALSLLFPAWGEWRVVLIASLPVLVLVPVIFRYSRILWMHLDRWIAPDEDRF
jgi:uncharacterized protein (DUF983 family)